MKLSIDTEANVNANITAIYIGPRDIITSKKSEVVALDRLTVRETTADGYL